MIGYHTFPSPHHSVAMLFHYSQVSRPGLFPLPNMNLLYHDSKFLTSILVTIYSTTPTKYKRVVTLNRTDFSLADTSLLIFKTTPVRLELYILALKGLRPDHLDEEAIGGP